MNDRSSGRIVPLAPWTSLHPLALEVARGERAYPARQGPLSPRSQTLGAALVAANRRWGADVEDAVTRWLAGADAIVTGQQPGLLGGPLLTLVKACAVAAEVRRRRAAGRDAVAFLWLATADDDLPEMRWCRVADREELVGLSLEGWDRGAAVGGSAELPDSVAAYLAALEARFPSEFGREALALAQRCFAPGVTLGEASGRFFGALLRGLDVVIVDSLEAELARAAAPTLQTVLAGLPSVWEALDAGVASLRDADMPVALGITPGRLPVFRLEGGRRVRIRTENGACPTPVLAEFAAHPDRFVPNAWLRPLQQDAALGTSVAILGGAELAYHAQTSLARESLALGRPEWRLRPHVTVLTAAERRLADQLGVRPDDLLSARRPEHTLPGRTTRRRSDALARSLDRAFAGLESAQRTEVPSLAGDLEATRRKLTSAVEWWRGRLSAAAHAADETAAGRWARLRAFARPNGHPQERELSVLAPLLKLGTQWPARLVAALDPSHPGMHLLHWDEGEAW